MSVTELQLSAASEERDTLRDDLSNSAAGRDALIKKAWDVRDAAVKRKNATQIELAKSRIDVMQVGRAEGNNKKVVLLLLFCSAISF